MSALTGTLNKDQNLLKHFIVYFDWRSPEKYMLVLIWKKHTGKNKAEQTKTN